MTKEELLEEIEHENLEEIVRLIEWLESKGHTAEEIQDCIRFIAREAE